MYPDYWTTQVWAQVLAVVASSALFAFAQDGRPAPATDRIVEQMVTAKTRQVQQLQAFEVVQDYHVDYRGFGGGHHAEMQVLTTYTSPNKKEFRIVSQSGSRFLLDRILSRLLESEKEYQMDAADSDLGPRNYDFKLLGTEPVAGNEAYVMEITPRRKAKYLCRGKIWVSARDFAILRLEGTPAKNPSFWISHTEVANTYQKISDFWLPVHKDATTDVRFGGKAVLAIDYSRYHITSRPKASTEAWSWALFGIPRSDPAAADRR